MTVNFKRVLAMGDPHCGHQVGLSPPEYHMPTTSDHKFIKLAKVRRSVWNWFDRELKPFRPINILINNGDALDGKGERSGGTEQITSDRKVQCDIAKKVIEFIDPSIIRMTYGTPYHTGSGEDWEDIVAEAVGAKIGSHEWFEINGKIFDCKHKIAASGIPHGKLTPLAKEILWNRIWHSRGMQPKADVLLRSHTHSYDQIDHDGCLGFILPALQGFGSKYGSRACSGTVDIGFVIIDVYNNGEIRWVKRLAEIEITKAKAEKL